MVEALQLEDAEPGEMRLQVRSWNNLMHVHKKRLLQHPPAPFLHSIHTGATGRTTLLVHSPADLRRITDEGVERFDAENPPVLQPPASDASFAQLSAI
eukprot:8915973-Prorocentrum_lima.AAC.1